MKAPECYHLVVWLMDYLYLGVSDSNKKKIVEVHNNIRAGVNPTASNMEKMVRAQNLTTFVRYSHRENLLYRIWAHNSAFLSGNQVCLLFMLTAF